LDRSRQWGRTVSEINQDHVNRYRFAQRYATGRVLDAACGCGYGSKLLLEAASSVVGVDDSLDAIAWAHEFYRGPQYLKFRIEEAPWVGSFDTIVSLETLEHMRDPKPALEAFRKSCSGVFIASVPNENLYPFKADTFANDDSPHFRHYTPEEFESLVEGVGFKVAGKFCQVSKQDPEIVRGTEGRFLVFVCQ
jgi:2-polyprenyl-3-methyl-5-hydroxy-6-metoxy-1,4-benzoquinol methylase